MAKNLVIVESPTKCRTIKKFLGKDYEIKASMGHLRDLPKGEMGVDVTKGFDIKYVVDRAKSKVVKDLRNSAQKAQVIFLAPDHDREGEAIAWHLTHILKDSIKGKPVHRITFNQITKRAILVSIDKPTSLDLDMVNSQQARRVLDRIVGYNVSPLLWRVVAKNLSAGRVQSVALRMVCEKEELIRAFVPKEFWSFAAVCQKNEYEPFTATMTKWMGKKVDINTKKSADAVQAKLKKSDARLDSITKKTKKIRPLPPFITSSLQQTASSVLGFSPKKTMMVAQRLYEGVNIGSQTQGLITYMRTDSFRMANEAIASIRKIVQKQFGKTSLSSKTNVFKNRKAAQDAHEAIRPTDCSITPREISQILPKDQFKLYQLIWKRAVATQMTPCVVAQKKAVVAIGEGTFEARSSSVQEKGFTACYDKYFIPLGQKIDDVYKAGDAVDIKDWEQKQNFTKPPSRFTDGLLVKELEQKGIGRPSTYASIISTIVARTYVKLVKKQLVATELGMVVNKFLVSEFDSFFNFEFTSVMESELDEIELGKVEWKGFITKYYSSISSLIEQVDIKKAKKELEEPTDIICEKCGKPMVVKWGRAGRFIACTGFPKCRNLKNFSLDDKGKIVIEKQEDKKQEVLDEKCPKCSSALVKKKGRFGEFIACSNYPKCKFTKSLSLGISCPVCDGEIVERRGKKGKFYACSLYPKCKFASNRKPVNLSCPNCQNPYLVEAGRGGKTPAKKCPKCKTDFK